MIGLHVSHPHIFLNRITTNCARFLELPINSALEKIYRALIAFQHYTARSFKMKPGSLTHSVLSYVALQLDLVGGLL